MINLDLMLPLEKSCAVKGLDNNSFGKSVCLFLFL